MLAHFNLLYSLASLVLSTQFLVRALGPVQVPSQIVSKIEERPHNGSAVPGDSPVRYFDDPNNDVFKIRSLDMFPNPCVLESYCTIIINGEFTIPLTNTTPHVSFNVSSHLPNGREGYIPGEDALCNWVDIFQNDDDDDSFPLAIQPAVPTSLNTELYSGLMPDPVNSILHRRKMKRSDKLSCPPNKGKAQISSTIILLGGYVPEANFTVKVKATAEGVDGKENRTIFNLWTEFELRPKSAVGLK